MSKFLDNEIQALEGVEVKKTSSNTFVLSKTDKTLQVGNTYLITLKDFILHPSENFTLASNWNRGIVPKYKTMRVSIVQVMGKMIKVDGIGVDENGADTSDMYLGLWLPEGGIETFKIMPI